MENTAFTSLQPELNALLSGTFKACCKNMQAASLGYVGS
jgi:hypothetical protein